MPGGRKSTLSPTSLDLTVLWAAGHLPTSGLVLSQLVTGEAGNPRLYLTTLRYSDVVMEALW